MNLWHSYINICLVYIYIIHYDIRAFTLRISSGVKYKFQLPLNLLHYEVTSYDKLVVFLITIFMSSIVTAVGMTCPIYADGLYYSFSLCAICLSISDHYNFLPITFHVYVIYAHVFIPCWENFFSVCFSSVQSRSCYFLFYSKNGISFHTNNMSFYISLSPFPLHFFLVHAVNLFIHHYLQFHFI